MRRARMKKYIFTAVVVGITSITGTAGPFGLSMGMTLEQVKKAGNFVPGSVPFVFKSQKVENGHPGFESYILLLTPTHGLCSVTATGIDVVTSVYGTELEEKHKEFVGALTNKYGKPSNSFDFVRNGSIWGDSNEWMMALYRKDRTLATFWSREDGVPLPDSLTTISIDTVALSTSKGYVTIKYEFNNNEVCVRAAKAKRDANL
jgi:hypothetical protein